MSEDPLHLLDVHDGAVADFVALARDLSDDEWHRATDLPGWDVHDLVAHTAHLEAVVAGAPEETVAVPEGLAHVRSAMGAYTEQGVIARRDRDGAALLAEIVDRVEARHAETRATPPTDLAAPAARTPGDIGWSWATLLSNRPLDVFMHEQDIRRAVGRPGHGDSAAARHVVGVFGQGLGFVLGKRAGAAPGTTAAVELTDSGRRLVATVGDDGRGRPAPADTAADVTLRMDTETYLVLSGGRREPASVSVSIDGDADLGHWMLSGMSLTP